jgi:hypothetical protein
VRRDHGWRKLLKNRPHDALQARAQTVSDAPNLTTPASLGILGAARLLACMIERRFLSAFGVVRVVN